MHEKMVEWDYKKTERRVLYMLGPSSLWCHKKIVAGMESKQTYYIFHILIPKSVLVFCTFTFILFDYTDLIIAQL